MTKKDLHLIYKQETGNYPPTVDDDILLPDLSAEEYITWLEEKLLNLYNITP